MKEKEKPKIIETCVKCIFNIESDLNYYFSQCINCKRAYNAGTEQRETFEDLYKKKED